LTGPDVIGAGQDQGAGLVDRLHPFGTGGALGDHQRADRLHRAVAALRGAAGAAGQGRPGGADRIQRIGLACPPPVLPVRPVDLHHPHAGCGDVPGQPSAVTAGPLDADQAHRAEPGQPAQQLAIPGRGGRELLHPQQPADRVERRRDVHVSVSVHAAGDGARLHTCLYDGHCHPFLWLRG
jgi:hypothetical protein